jgi:hypothetical protein
MPMTNYLVPGMMALAATDTASTGWLEFQIEREPVSSPISLMFRGDAASKMFNIQLFFSQGTFFVSHSCAINGCSHFQVHSSTDRSRHG